MLFASYSRADTAIVDALASVLEQNGYQVWIDRTDIEGGAEWRSKIASAIETCVAFLLILSHNSIASRNVRREIDVAESADRQIIPVMIEQVTLPPELRYQLSSIQMIEMPDLSHHGSAFSSARLAALKPNRWKSRNVLLSTCPLARAAGFCDGWPAAGCSGEKGTRSGLFRG